MNQHVSRRPSLEFSVILLILLILGFLQGCDSLSSSNTEEHAHDSLTNVEGNPNDSRTHARQRAAPDPSANRFSDATLLLELASESIETSRDLPKLTRRIELEYGVLRRLLKRYGIDIQIMESQNMNRTDLHDHVGINRLLKRYGITPGVLTENGDQLTDSLLAAHSITEDILLSEGIDGAMLENYNAFNTLLNDHGMSVEQYVRDQRSTEPELQSLGFLDTTPPGLHVALDTNILDEVLVEMSDDPDIQNIQPFE